MGILSNYVTALVVDGTSFGIRLAVFFFILQINKFSAYLIAGLYCINLLATFLHRRNVIKQQLEQINMLMQQAGKEEEKW